MQQKLRLPFIPLFAAIALLFQTLLPFYATYQAPHSAEAAKMAAVLGEKVLLCTAEGFRFVSWKELLQSKEQHKPHKQYQCAICYAAAHGQGLKASTIIAAATSLIAVAENISFIAASPPLAERDWQQRLTRSPPSILL